MSIAQNLWFLHWRRMVENSHWANTPEMREFYERAAAVAVALMETECAIALEGVRR